MKTSTFLKTQLLPVGLTIIICGLLIAGLWLEISFINQILHTNISLKARGVDILVGLTIYLKTSIDFAIYIGNLMEKNPTWKGRIAIEVGTALGNAFGTFVIIALWALFQNIPWLSALMILIAALVLFKLAEDGFRHAIQEDTTPEKWYSKTSRKIMRVLLPINHVLGKVLQYIMPNLSMKGAEEKGFFQLLKISIFIPFILGLDDFAGYLPLFDIIKIFGFAIGVFVGHMLLNMMLYISPRHTIKAVKNPIISLLGGLAFIGLGLWGIIDVIHLIFLS